MSETPSTPSKPCGLLIASVALNAATLLLLGGFLGALGFGMARHHAFHHGMGGPGMNGCGAMACHENGFAGPGMGAPMECPAPAGHEGLGGPGHPGAVGGPGPIAGPVTPEQMDQRHLDFLGASLNLTPDQKAKIAPILAAERNAVVKAISDGHAQIRALLTPEQQKKLDAVPKAPGA